MMQLTTVRWVPAFAQGYVRDLCVRWALEEAGFEYSLKLVGFDDLKTKEYRQKQIFGQVPVFEDGNIQLFESGSIVLHIAEKSDKLLPSDSVGRARSRSWIFAALDSVQPAMQNFITADDNSEKEEWARLRKPLTLATLKKRLGDLETWMQGREYLEKQFSAGDLMMTTILRHLVDSGVIQEFSNLNQYRLRCEGRPAFKKAFADQVKTFTENAP